MEKVFIYKETEYTDEGMHALIERIFSDIGCDMLGKNVLIKPNLVTKNGVDTGATTHPKMLRALCIALLERGHAVSIAESHGGTYTDSSLESQFKACGVTEAVAGLDVKLCTKAERTRVSCPDGLAVKQFELVKACAEADCIIDMCKVKTHALTMFSCCAKNMFGCVPGLSKFELHASFTEPVSFTRMLNDLCLLKKPVLCIADGIRGMQGNGPTAGITRDFGFVAASRDAYACDLVCAHLLGLKAEDVPQLADAVKRGLIPEKLPDGCTNLSAEELESMRIKDCVLPDTHSTGSVSLIAKLQRLGGGRFIKLFQPKPKIKKSLCVACGKCAEYCPVKTIDMKSGKPKINRKSCIRCFCCQELCPKKAIFVKTNRILKL